ncbi:bifunctional indole-3-glycerol-phosphate synthase TrpC/phosphoribosylanthranilate isomerase TrpF [Helicobacter heilmannii]|uniref:Multifunctional fusion protein n=1 Tax=Helicobacter heilmannii TaxID=35817 RepID=A0A0K2Y536_HELHE|nr:bifunctional indole-3-glycerol-phosphate synthase TrpC/phosphoribosylanthranilate isomerase TrpF [Helicobacter heilmannii]CRF47327.1 Indole-3-glycerol phosphate synthase / Phosphoribosylanthranilate isomerase [Helicobacter heilmannii]CRF48720.1 Indole-3-glycerol phosphate synthase / Phosphoribosylanthranilate isomerase [Helicobacter heilmannii]CRI34251.1 Indole-3-glycerol phosphate synthase / Phosphoribosylanthranilate isomerase [Helicobacter heilmannii]BDQ27173.1 tryptophan biosynthesis pro
MHDLLKTMVEHKKKEVQALKKRYSLPAELRPSQRNFKEALQERRTSFILECKQASPSKGLIRSPFDLVKIAKVYERYATCISVLTDEKYFKGAFENLRIVAEHSTKPLLCKDFILDPFQVRLARFMGADAILLMLSVLDDESYAELATLAQSLSMAVLTEVSDQAELQRALDLNAPIVGINNRDLKTLKVDIHTTLKLAPLIAEDKILVSESGINSHAVIKQLCHKVQGFLVGSHLMAQKNLEKACKKLILGENKVCGLKRVKDARAVLKNGFIYGGLIFDPQSPRYIAPKKAKKLIKKVPKLDFVGVFVQAKPKTIIKRAYQLGLKAVQLHGYYSQEDLHLLQNALDCPVWLVASIDPHAKKLPQIPNAPLVLFDSKGAKAGGNGVAFAWELLEGFKRPFMLAGGLNASNLEKAAAIGALGLDLNSGVENAPGRKSGQKIAQVAKMLREY